MPERRKARARCRLRAARLRDAGFTLVLVSNQPAAAKGNVSEARSTRCTSGCSSCSAWSSTASTTAAITPAGSVPELTGACECRKPAPGLLLRAAANLELDLAASWIIGDADTDVEAAHAAGVACALVEHPQTAHRRQRAPMAATSPPTDLAGRGGP